MEKPTRSWRRKIPTRWSRPHLIIGGLLVVLIIATTLAGLFFTPHDPLGMNIGNRLSTPTRDHWFGTDQYGRDLFSRILVGSRNSLMVGLIAVIIGIGLGVPIGSLAADFGERVDSLLMRSMDLVYGFPPVIVAVLITSIFGPGLTNSMIAIGLFNVPIFARITRGNFLSLRERQFVEASKAVGRTKLGTAVHHILPNLSSPIIVQASTQFALAILAEAALSYLGLGTQPPNPSWGLMLKQAQTYLGHSPWPAIFPGIFIIISVLGFNMLGDGVRDLLDPKTGSSPTS